MCAAQDLGAPTLDTLQELVDQILIRQALPSAGAARYTMLETVREFAAERLVDMREVTDVQASHASAFGSLATDLARPPCWPAKAGLDLLELEHDNFRAALDWYQREDPAAALRLANKLTAFWSARGHFSEARRRLDELLEGVPEGNSERAAALSGVGWLATDQGDYAAANGLLGQSVALAHAAHDLVAEGYALFYRARATIGSGRIAAGGRDAEDALDLLTQADDTAGVASALFFCALATQYSGTSSSPVICSRDAQRPTRRAVCLPAQRARYSCLVSRA